jgi:hypothetical protein
MSDLLEYYDEVINFKMDFDTWLNNWSYTISEGYIKEEHASSYFHVYKKPTRKLKEYELTLDLIEKLEEIKNKYSANSTKRIKEVQILLENFNK